MPLLKTLITINFFYFSNTGIDFGLAFGAATRNLPTPEMIPFRLTPHIINIMDPMGVSGIITKCMEHSLRTFKQSKNILLACMDVFIKEPNLDWLYQSKRDSEKSSEWDASLRLKIASKKLSGANPRKLIEDELEHSIISEYPDYYRGYLKLLKGDEQSNIRARLPDENLNVGEQIQCLIDLASDPAILGVTYGGFQPWI